MEKFDFESRQDKKEFTKIPKEEQKIAREIFSEESRNYKKEHSLVSPKKLSPEKIAEINDARTLSDAELIKAGARTVADKHSADHTRLDVTEDQVKKAQILMDIDIIRKKINERQIERFKPKKNIEEDKLAVESEIELAVIREYAKLLLQKTGLELHDDGRIYDSKNKKYSFENNGLPTKWTGKKWIFKKVHKEMPLSEITLTMINGEKVRGEYEPIYSWLIRLNNENNDIEKRGLLYSNEKTKGWKTKINDLGLQIWNGDFTLNKVVKIEK